ncbi:MAG: leucyl-tRNA synthetase [Flavipsychrobacter sp.]|jgi:leucyl-tRNA synthetase/very-short-patch-repair endonuclease|nr:leucyl-tRNA synthetase [Flavipsychrobacter sp.]
MEYNFTDIESRAKDKWAKEKVYKVSNESDKPKCYVLDMFPYPSGAGLHVGHPLGYIASDIYARYKRLCGYNVLHPMGFDAFGLPAEQYAIETGQHPADTTQKNIARYIDQLNKIGFCYDWDREVRTSDPKYYKWTQWIFLQLFHSWYDRAQQKARPISELVSIFEKEGNTNNACPGDETIRFDTEEWKGYNEKEKRSILMQYRIAYQDYAQVWWCEALGTVLANDEVVNGVSERGGHPVERKNMRQWFLRITEYAERLLTSLKNLDWSEAMKEMQRNWIGKSNGAEVYFKIDYNDEREDNVLPPIRVFTTRPDTIFGVDFIVLAPEHELVDSVTLTQQKQAIEEYKTYVKSRSERERMSEVKQVTGCFTGAYVQHPFTGRNVPIWISEYVLAGYGTGAIMAVPSGDERDHAFAKHFNIPITNIFGDKYTGEEAYSTKTGTIYNSDFLIGLSIQDASEAAINALVKANFGKRKVNYRLRDAGFSRQRYWGEPFPIVYVDDVPYAIDEEPFDGTDLNELPVELPHVESYKPGPEGQGPLANLREWASPRPSPQVERVTSREEDEPGEVRRNPGPKYSVQHIKLFENARLNRKNATASEDILWQSLRNNQLGEKFRRQHPIEYYVVDFVSLSKGLIIEIDGGYHEDAQQQAYDIDRAKTLEALGFTVLRFTNEMVLQRLEDVLIAIKENLISAPSPQVEKGSVDQHVTLSIYGEGRGEVTRETNTMPGYAGSSWYFLRYMDPNNDAAFADRKATDYWNQVDLYIGGTEHAVGHLLYSRMWTKALCDLGHISFDEPFKKLLNQGMIQGMSYFTGSIFWESETLLKREDFIRSYENVGENPVAIPGKKYTYNGVDGKSWYGPNTRLKYGHLFVDTKSRLTRSKYQAQLSLLGYNEDDIKGRLENSEWTGVTEDGEQYIQCKMEVEKMSKSKYNVVNPDDIVAQYGADTFRMYEMFLGPIDVSKPWDTKGIEGVHRFLKKMWRLYADEQKGWIVTDEKATDAELRILHKTIKKIGEDIERFSFNTSVSQFMICVNELSGLNCHKREILEPLAIAICPFAPHIAEELWQKLGNAGSVINAAFPKYEEKYVTDNSKMYPVAINGKTRVEMEFPLDAEQSFIEKEVLADAAVQKWLEGKAPKKFIYVKGKMINVVV